MSFTGPEVESGKSEPLTTDVDLTPIPDQSAPPEQLEFLSSLSRVVFAEMGSESRTVAFEGATDTVTQTYMSATLTDGRVATLMRSQSDLTSTRDWWLELVVDPSQDTEQKYLIDSGPATHSRFTGKLETPTEQLVEDAEVAFDSAILSFVTRRLMKDYDVINLDYLGDAEDFDRTVQAGDRDHVHVTGGEIVVRVGNAEVTLRAGDSKDFLAGTDYVITVPGFMGASVFTARRPKPKAEPEAEAAATE